MMKSGAGRLTATFMFAGDEKYDVSETMPALSPKVGIVANMQANTVIGILMNKTER